MTDAVNPEFNLLDEPWIPVINNDNQSEKVSITDAVLNSNNYKSLDCELPSENFAVLRLLIAFLYSSLDLTKDNWEDYWNDGFPEDQIRAYASKWHDRFWLIHPEHPFMQAADLRDAVKKLDEGMKGTMADYVIASVAETAIMDVYPYSAEPDVKPEFPDADKR